MFSSLGQASLQVQKRGLTKRAKKQPPCFMRLEGRPRLPGSVAADWWDSAAFSSIFLASGFSCSQTESTPAHMRVTQIVGC